MHTGNSEVRKMKQESVGSSGISDEPKGACQLIAILLILLSETNEKHDFNVNHDF